MWIPVLKCLDGKKNFEKKILSSDELVCVKSQGKHLIFSTINGEEYQLSAILEEWEILLKNEDFYEVDRGLIANMRLASHVDAKLRLLYFPSGHSCTVSVRGLQKIKEIYTHIRLQ